MKKALMSGLLSMAALLSASPAWSSDWPMSPGDYWEMTGVRLKDGGALGYAKFLAGEWKANQEFAKSKGWIKGYAVLSNVYNRKGEPDLYLVTITDRLVTGAESEKRDDEYMAWKKKSTAQMQKESGDRLEIREIEGSQLLQELKFK
ncbi:hypothetical protein [Roseateles violae]|uniref:Uncharacterized protein n=1 Tax=Roseateles violae TaxID=3058042 RepID=A0ABT8DMJ8_9BURK|nr:hypothetical protein [Pelomonas sp. PFR6]MDN3919342.1 hypothetical protein [Pelomonas sp. PFR6]